MGPKIPSRLGPFVSARENSAQTTDTRSGQNNNNQAKTKSSCSMVADASSWFSDIDGTGNRDKGKNRDGPAGSRKASGGSSSCWFQKAMLARTTNKIREDRPQDQKALMLQSQRDGSVLKFSIDTESIMTVPANETAVFGGCGCGGRTSEEEAATDEESRQRRNSKIYRGMPNEVFIVESQPTRRRQQRRTRSEEQFDRRHLRRTGSMRDIWNKLTLQARRKQMAETVMQKRARKAQQREDKGNRTPPAVYTAPTGKSPRTPPPRCSDTPSLPRRRSFMDQLRQTDPDASTPAPGRSMSLSRTPTPGPRESPASASASVAPAQPQPQKVPEKMRLPMVGKAADNKGREGDQHIQFEEAQQTTIHQTAVGPSSSTTTTARMSQQHQRPSVVAAISIPQPIVPAGGETSRRRPFWRDRNAERHAERAVRLVERGAKHAEKATARRQREEEHERRRRERVMEEEHVVVMRNGRDVPDRVKSTGSGLFAGSVSRLFARVRH